MRISEICALKIKDVAPHGKILDEICLEKHRTKSDESREIALSEQAKAAVKQWLEVLKEKNNLKKENPVFPNTKKPWLSISPNWGSQLLGEIFARAGVVNASSHSMRRTLINALDRSGVRLDIIRAQVGHSSIATTQKYLVATPEERKKAIKKIKY
jgi:integrase/recombinase XerD